jgi:hypothetical protein
MAARPGKKKKIISNRNKELLWYETICYVQEPFGKLADPDRIRRSRNQSFGFGESRMASSGERCFSG